MEKNIYLEKAEELAVLLKSKNEAYGDSCKNSTEILKILYPDGVSLENYENMLIIVRILDKLSRIANDENAFAEDPWQDIAGYSLLQLIHKSRKVQQQEDCADDAINEHKNVNDVPPEYIHFNVPVNYIIDRGDGRGYFDISKEHPCAHCANSPQNGGSGICNCILPMLWSSGGG